MADLEGEQNAKKNHRETKGERTPDECVEQHAREGRLYSDAYARLFNEQASRKASLLAVAHQVETARGEAERQRLDAANRRHQVEWRWLKGHAGHELNERADELARAAIKALRDGIA